MQRNRFGNTTEWNSIFRLHATQHAGRIRILYWRRSLPEDPRSRIVSTFTLIILKQINTTLTQRIITCACTQPRACRTRSLW